MSFEWLTPTKALGTVPCTEEAWRVSAVITKTHSQDFRCLAPPSGDKASWPVRGEWSEPRQRRGGLARVFSAGGLLYRLDLGLQSGLRTVVEAPPLEQVGPPASPSQHQSITETPSMKPATVKGETASSPRATSQHCQG